MVKCMLQHGRSNVSLMELWWHPFQHHITFSHAFILEAPTVTIIQVFADMEKTSEKKKYYFRYSGQRREREMVGGVDGVIEIEGVNKEAIRKQVNSIK